MQSERPQGGIWFREEADDASGRSEADHNESRFVVDVAISAVERQPAMQLVEVRAGEGGGSGWSWEWRPSGGLSEPTFNGSGCAGPSEGACVRSGRSERGPRGRGRRWRVGVGLSFGVSAREAFQTTRSELVF